MLRTYASIWTEANKICKAWVLINQILPRYFYYYGNWLNKSNHQVNQVDISEPTDINQSISMNQSILSNRSVDFHPEVFCFLIFHHNSIFSTHAKRACYSNKWKASLKFVLQHLKAVNGNLKTQKKFWFNNLKQFATT